jgi:Domain of unknown function (DUF4373)
MLKETYYFSHDYEPTGDPKMQAMIGNYGSCGYGIFWRIVEMLHADKEHKLPLKIYIYEAIAKQMLTDAKQVSTFVDDCVKKFELFLSDGEYIWSNRVIRNIEKREDISRVRSLAGKASAQKKKQMSTSVEHKPTFVEQNLTKERKGKEKKEIIRGKFFSEDKTEVVFEDGSRQKLGHWQTIRIKEGSFEPHYIKKGIIE